jgi:polar amino acid transport system substrate-binding protein
MIFTATGIARCLLLLASLILMSCDRGSPQPTSGGAGQSGGTAGQDRGWASLGDLAQAQGRIGVILGTVFAPYVEQTFPQARVTTFNSTTDQVVALKTGKVDTGLFDAISAQTLIRAHPELGILDEGFFTYPLGIGFRRDRAELRERFNRFLERLRADGGFEEIQHRWLVADPEQAVMPDFAVTDPRDDYVLGVSVADLPYVAIKDDRYVGLDIEILQRFAAEEAIGLEILSLDFGALIPALAAGKVDIITDGMAITAERSRALDFSIPYAHGSAVALALNSRLAKGMIAGPADPPTAPGTAAGTGGWQSLADLAQGRIAVFTGTAQDLFATRAFPEAEILRLNSQADFVLAVKTGKADAAITEAVSIRAIARDDPELAVLADDFYDMPIAAAFPKEADPLRERFDRFIAAAKADGTLEEIQRRWLVADPESVVMPLIPVSESGETLRVGTSLMVGLPYVAQDQGRFIGYDMELIQTFAAREGLRLEMVPLEFDALLTSLAVGKIDMIMSRLSITEERRAKVDFSTPYDHEYSAALVQKKNLAPTRGEAGGESQATASPSSSTSARGGWRSLDDLARGRIAVFAGAIQDHYVVHTYPEAQVIHLNGHADLITSLKTGKVDAGIIIATSAPDILKANPDIGLLGEPILPVSQAAAFRPGDRELRERFDRFMATILADGTHADMHARWFEADAKQALMPDIPLPETGPVLRLGTSVFVGLPYVGLVDGHYVGFDIELARRFAAHEGMRLELTPLEFSTLIPALTAGKLDLIASALAVTEERQKQVAFSTPYAEVSSVTLALKKNMEPGGQGIAEAPRPEETEPAPGFLAGLEASFYSNLVLEQRWRLVLNGLWATLLISVASTLLGTLLGALICYLRMSRRTLPRLLGSGYIFLIRGLPVLLLLMLIFYVAFASVNIDPLIVAVIAFGMNFAAYVSEMFRTGIEGVDRGQTEAGIAMGFTRLQTFLYIVLPQATRRILPVYRGEFISLVKMTSIVGYIGVQDLTKAGDIIRSRTFEAFFPLIMVAAIYFLVIWVLGLALDHIDRRTDPKRRVKVGLETS